MAKWWDRKWRLVIAAILLPILLVPIISVFLFPETPLTTSLLYGLLLSLFVAMAIRILQLVELYGLRLVILWVGGLALLVLLFAFAFRTKLITPRLERMNLGDFLLLCFVIACILALYFFIRNVLRLKGCARITQWRYACMHFLTMNNIP